MSIIFGICKRRGAITELNEMQRLAAATIGHASDGTFLLTHEHIGMGYQPYHTHAESGFERQPARDTAGNLLVIDGRIDNRSDLRQNLGISDPETPDSALVLAAFKHWGTRCFSLFVGDWAIALWSDSEQRLFLARDHAGARTLYFRKQKESVQWGTYLETFSPSVDSGPLDKTYVAGYLGLIPIGDRTPYKDIRAVPPAHYLVIQGDRMHFKPHWNWMPSEQLRYKSDTDYDERFLELFRTSVERRTGAGAPILAQLSGGIDSTAIVCISDHSRRSSKTQAQQLLDTLSYYDDTEPSWNESPYFSITESYRGKIGIHVNCSSLSRTFEPSAPLLGNYLLPGADSSTFQGETRFHETIGGDKYRVVLSGFGGDEVTGGVPTPSPELANYLVAGRLVTFSRRAGQWCLATRNCLTELIPETVKFTFSLYMKPRLDIRGLAPWITPQLRKLCMEQIAAGDSLHPSRIGLSPSAICNGLTWWTVLDTLPHLSPPALVRREYRYPYLDRDLVDFLFRVPPEQLLGPNRRRLMMRRAVKHILPTAIVERKRKAFVSRAPIALLRDSANKIGALFENSLAAEYGLIDPKRLISTLALVGRGADTRWWATLMATVDIELWLRSSCRGHHTARGMQA